MSFASYTKSMAEFGSSYFSYNQFNRDNIRESYNEVKNIMQIAISLKKIERIICKC